MRLKHPTNPDVSKDVPDDIAEKWLSNGWTEDKPVATPSVEKPAAKKATAPKKN